MNKNTIEENRTFRLYSLVNNLLKMKIQVSYLSHFGKVRKNNEDSLLVQDELISEANMEEPITKVLESDKLLLAVADGMGGHTKGEVASRKVLEILKDNSGKLDQKKQVQKTFNDARMVLNDIVKEDKKSLGLGTTVSGMFISPEKATIFSCGDSRVYRLNGNHLEKLTIDHSLVQGLYESGIIAEEEMRTHPQKNIITSSISGDMTNNKPLLSYREIIPQKGNVFLICTDGLWESMTALELYDCVTKEGISEKISSLKNKSLRNYGRDNISIIYVEILEI
ncbi:MAG: serine/threonine-protein phosphatase [Leptospiraceae bacterium]|nr:serine/threonine-protein phosphatase [Leptospiraceae bacterium]MCP5500638.1 serine/threonine-protein phosphatase [Leptospiraceae bacterium]